nr:hypothetical protein [Nostoc sp. EkiNYC01]
MTTIAVELLTSSLKKLFSSTVQALDFWLSVSEKRETMPTKA